MKTNTIIQEPLDKVIRSLEEEARMILPGIQALFGFQLIAVFNQRFVDLSRFAQTAHFIALLCSAFAVLLVLALAAYHRQAEPRQISDRLCGIGSFCLTFSLLPLSIGTSLDIYVIGELLKYSFISSAILAALTFLLLISGWFIFPRIFRHKT